MVDNQSHDVFYALLTYFKFRRLISSQSCVVVVSHIYKEDTKYKKYGVFLTCLEQKSGHTYNLLSDFEAIEKRTIDESSG